MTQNGIKILSSPSGGRMLIAGLGLLLLSGCGSGSKETASAADQAAATQHSQAVVEKAQRDPSLSPAMKMKIRGAATTGKTATP